MVMVCTETHFLPRACRHSTTHAQLREDIFLGRVGNSGAASRTVAFGRVACHSFHKETKAQEKHRNLDSCPKSFLDDEETHWKP